MLNSFFREDETINEAFLHGQRFFQSQDKALVQHRKAIDQRLQVALREFRLSLRLKESKTDQLELLVSETCAYVHWLGWSLDDIGYLSICCGVNSDVMVRRIIACHFVYQSGRMLDDAVDQHEDYKGLRQTLFGVRKEHWKNRGETDQSRNENLLMAVALLLRGIRDYTTCFGHDIPNNALHNLLGDATGACLGAIVEINERPPNDEESYSALVSLKTAMHNSILLQPFHGLINPQEFRQLSHFYKKTSLVGQILNDALDVKEDLVNGQPNYFINVERTCENSTISFTEAERVRDLVRKLAIAARKNAPRFQEPCFAKIATLIHKSEQIPVQ